MSELTIEHLREPAEIRAFAETARSEGRLALDTEFVWERTYSPVPCLLQLATAERVAVRRPARGRRRQPRSPSSSPTRPSSS